MIKEVKAYRERNRRLQNLVAVGQIPDFKRDRM